MASAFYGPSCKLVNSATYVHPVDERVKLVLSGKFTHFTYSGRTLPGVHQTLQKRVWPLYRFDAATHNDTRQCASALSAPKWKPRFGTTDVVKRGQRKGRKADTVLMDSLRLKRKYRLEATLYSTERGGKRVKREQCKSWLEQRAPVLASIGDEKKLMSLLNARAPDLQLLWSTFVKHQLRPVACQVQCCLPGSFATAVDCVALNERNELVLVELKKGGQSYLYNHTTHPLAYPFSDHNDCVLNQWFIQLAATQIAYVNSFPDHVTRLAPSRLLRINEAPLACDLFQLPDWVTGRLHPLLNVLKSS